MWVHGLPNSLLAAVLEQLPSGVMVLDVTGRVVWLNTVGKRIAGLADAAPPEGASTDVMLAAMDGLAPSEAVLSRTLAGEKVEGLEYTLRRCSDGREIWIGGAAVPLRDGDGLILGTIVIFQDITQKLTLARELAESEARFRSLYAAIGCGVIVERPHGEIIEANAVAANIFGLAAEQMRGRRVADIWRAINEDGSTAVHADYPSSLAARTGRPVHGIVQRITSLDGQQRWLQIDAVPVIGDDGLPVQVVSSLVDITAWLEAEHARRAAEAKYRTLVEQLPVITYIATCDDLASRLYVSPQVEAILGFPPQAWVEDPGLWARQLHPLDRERVLTALASALATGQPFVAEYRMLAADGRVLWFRDEARELADPDDQQARTLQGVMVDMTSQKRAEDELRQAQKLESVGRLAAGIAHELNTPIQFVGDNVQFLKTSFATLEQLLHHYAELRRAATGLVAPELLATIEQAEAAADIEYLVEEIPRALAQTLEGVDRVATIVRAMKEFAHPGEKEKVPADLNHGLRNTLVVARNELKYVAEVETEFGDLPPVVCRPGDLNQVFLNLLVNAAHAIAKVVDGTAQKGLIRVRTCRDGDQVLVTISDTGCGIPEEIRAHIFEPFFTTKEVGRGTGQGLSLARAIVEQHGGSLTFESEVGKGTTFYIRLPVGDSVVGPQDTTP